MLGWHLIFSTYGFWLPNDPRGSGSSRVRAQHLYEAGSEARKVHTTHRAHDVHSRRLAKDSLKYPAIELSGIQARAVARGIAAVLPKIESTIHACAIMPDHVHLVTAKHRFDGDELIACLKRAGTRGLNEEGLNPMSAYRGQSGRLPSPWGGKGWKVILDTQEHMNSATRYVERNPIRAGFKAQRWSFVVPFVG
jgi:REP element-mobilizing transposase RayT